MISEPASYWKDYQFSDYFMSRLSEAPPQIKEAPRDYFQYEPAFPDESDESTWQRHQSTMRKKFGRRVIKHVEQQSTGAHLTIRFTTGIKKLDSSFIIPL